MIKSRLQKKIERFITEELPLLIDKGFIQSKTLAASDVTGFSSVTENCNTEEKKTSKNGIKDAQISDIFAASNFYASWSGFEKVSKAITESDRIKMTRDKDMAVLDWQQFHKFLLQRMNAKTAGDRMRYASQFQSVLFTGNAAPLLELQPNKRIHAMKGLASLARFLGLYDRWMQIRQRYNLKWSTGNESLAAFQSFFDDSKSMESMIRWVQQAISVLPAPMGAVIKFNLMTGLRPVEAINALKLLKNNNTESSNNTIIWSMEC